MTPNRIAIAPGLSLPCYPMRPRMGVRLTNPEQATREVMALHETHVFQPKMNGDRVLVAKHDNKMVAYNRHLKPYHFKFDLRPWAKMTEGTCLDGEVKDGNFYPFELLSEGGVSYLNKPVEFRISSAQDLTAHLGGRWAFSFEAANGSPAGYVYDTSAISNFLVRHTTPGVDRTKVPYWEGVVAKKKGSTYNLMGSVVESPLWVKLKWEYAP